jgi:hypothetical protein
VTGITGWTAVGIAGDISVLVVHLVFVVGVAIYTGEVAIIGRNMAVRAIPLRMFSGFYGESVLEFRLRPEDMGGIMTEFAICGKTRCLMVWVLG